MRGARPLLALFLCATAGCAVVRGTFTGYPTARDGQNGNDHALREWLALGWYEAAARAVGRKGDLRPDDRLLRALYAGSVAYYAGDGRRAALAFDRASDMADERFTKSASQAGLAMVTNDRALAYMPGDNERVFIHFYAMLARVQAADREGAGVEARRLSWMLEHVDHRRDSLDWTTRAVMRYAAGAMFQSLGDREDAEVAYRNAAGLSGGRVDTTDLLQPVPADSADVVLIIERGFVAHKVEQALLIAVGQDEIGVFGSTVTDDSRSGAQRVSERVLSDLAPTHLGGYEYRSNRGLEYRDVDWLKIAWPVFHRPLLSGRWPVARVGAVADTAAPVSRTVLHADVSDAIVADYHRAAPLMMTRAILRAGVKYAIDKAAEDIAEKKEKKKEKNRAWWSLLSAAVDVSSWLLEAADTRSWHLLPAELTVARLRVPAGTTTVRIDAPSGGSVVLNDVNAPAGGVVVRGVRIWRDGDGRYRRFGEPAITEATAQTGRT